MTSIALTGGCRLWAASPTAQALPPPTAAPLTPSPGATRPAAPEDEPAQATPAAPARTLPAVTPTATEAILAAQEVRRWPAFGADLLPGQPVTSTLSEDSGLLIDETPFDLYEFEGRPGQHVILTLASNEFDAFLVLVGPDERILASNDDANPKETKDARLSLPLPAPGRYQVWVDSFTGERGPYTLALEVADHSEQDTRLTLGQPAQGWLIPGDRLSADGLYADDWTIQMPAEPWVVRLTSDEFDTQLRALTPDGRLLIEDDDANFVAGDGNSRLVLIPSARVPAGTELTLEVSMPQAYAVGGAYQLETLPLPLTYETRAVVKIRPVIVRGRAPSEGSQLTEAQILSAIAHADTLWQACGVRVEPADGERVGTMTADGLDNYTAGERRWTEDETLLHRHDSHGPYAERVVTAYFVKHIDGDEQYGVAYPSTRYPPGRSGIIVLSDVSLTDSSLVNVLAHEVGHILGLEHPNPVTGDGDPWNDTSENLMAERRPGGGLTPLQCVIARGDSHYLHAENDQPLVPASYQRHDKVLMPGDQITDALTTQNVEMSEGQFLEVYYFQGRQGDSITIDLQSERFDPVVILEGAGGEQLATDDDGGSGWNASLRLTLPESGDYSIGITSVERAVGVYQLAIRAEPP